MDSIHLPVLLEEVTNMLVTNTDGIYIDCTIGFGGHSKSILEQLDNGFLIGFDLDPYALKKAKEKLILTGKDNFSLYEKSYKEFPSVLSKMGIEKVDGFLFDLGISSYQIDSGHRGFSYSKDGPLNMRFDGNEKLSAKNYINNINENEFTEILRIYGDIANPKKIAKNIIKNKHTMNTTLDLINAIPNYPNKLYSKIFQAIRIAVNQEIESFKKALTIAPNYLKKNGRIAVISFHSIEDRITKHFFKNNRIINERDYYDVNIIDNGISLNILTKKPIIASDVEIKNNKRSRSAKLRVAERI